jgi:hypothetical protein
MRIDILMKSFTFISTIVITVFVAGSGCTDRASINEFTVLENSYYTVGDTSYVEIFPPYQLGLNAPTAVLYGKDQLLYVADTRNNRVVMLNAAGGILGECQIDQPISLAQDFRLDLLIGGTVTRNGNQVGALFRIHLVQALHNLDSAKIDTVWRESSHPNRRFVGLAALPDNTYLAARTGPDNASPIDPDTRVMEFSTSDKYITPITDLTTGTGTGINFINQITGITSIPNTRDFIVLQRSIGVAYGAISMKYSSSADFEGWKPVYDPTDPRTSSADFIRPNQFTSPAGCAIDSKRLDIFITDAAKDSVFKFSSKDGKFKKESFGKYGTNGRMKSPTGAAFFDKTLYIADSTANCIFRFKLSTDF